MNETKQFIISHKRAENVLTAKWNTKATIVVREDQEEEYKKYNPNPILAIPEKEDGNPGKARNAVLNRYKGENCLIMDDDLISVGYHEKGRIKNVNEDYLQLFCNDMFKMTEDLGTVVWGINLQSDKKFYREYSPFSLSSVILGPFYAIRNVDPSMRFDPNLFLKEDYDLSLQVLKKYRKILRNNKWFYMCEHITSDGGIVGIRTAKREEEHAKRFQRKWGSKIVKIQRKTQNGNLSINPVVKVPIKGI